MCQAFGRAYRHPGQHRTRGHRAWRTPCVGRLRGDSGFAFARTGDAGARRAARTMPTWRSRSTPRQTKARRQAARSSSSPHRGIRRRPQRRARAHLNGSRYLGQRLVRVGGSSRRRAPARIGRPRTCRRPFRSGGCRGVPPCRERARRAGEPVDSDVLICSDDRPRRAPCRYRQSHPWLPPARRGGLTHAMAIEASRRAPQLNSATRQGWPEFTGIRS